MPAPVRRYYAPSGQSTRYYDLITAADRNLAGDIDIYADLATPGDRILELGAGTGRVAIALARKGYHVDGVDIAPAMLAQAEAKRASLDEASARRLRFVRGDLTALSVGGLFDLVLCTYFTLAHLPAGAAWRNAFQGAAAHMKPGGAAAFHLPRLDRMAAPPPAPDQPVFRQMLDRGRELILFVAGRTFNPRIGRMDMTLDFVTTANGRVEHRSREGFTYYCADPAPFAAEAGLHRDGPPIDVGGDGEIHLFRKAA
jgi:SAM-dependent methyltransferase